VRCGSRQSAAEKLTLENARSFEPGGIPVQREGMWHVLIASGCLLSSGVWRAFAALLRVDEFREAVIPDDKSTSKLLREADDFASEHLAGDSGACAGAGRWLTPLPCWRRSRKTLELLDALRRLAPAKLHAV